MRRGIEEMKGRVKGKMRDDTYIWKGDSERERKEAIAICVTSALVLF